MIPGLTIFFTFIASPPLSAQDTVAQLKPVRAFEGGGLYVTDLDFSRDGKLLASSYEGTNIQLWSPSTGDQIRALAEPLSFPKQLYKLTTGRPPEITAVDFAPDPPWASGILAAGYQDGIRLWNARTGELVRRRLDGSFQSHFQTVEFSPEGIFLVGSTIDGKVTIWHTRWNQVLRHFHAHGPFDAPDTSIDLSTNIVHVDFSRKPPGKYLATGTSEAVVKVWNWRRNLGQQDAPNDTQPFHVFTRRAVQENADDLFQNVGGLVFKGNSEDVLALIVGGGDGTIRKWSIPEGKLLQEFQLNPTIQDLALDPNGDILAIAQNDNLTLYSLATNQKLAHGKEHTNAINSVEFSPSGKWIATGSGEINPRKRDDRVILWKNPFHSAGYTSSSAPPEE